MNKSVFIAFFLILSSSLLIAQKNINNYKYIIVPKQYEFQKTEDSYQINSLTKFLFERTGFITFFSTDKFPSELANNGCMALKAIVKNNSGMLNTKLNIELVDCYNNTVFTTSEAKSKEKDYKRAYQATIRETFKDIEALNYSYNPVNISEVENVEIKDEKLKIIEKQVVKEVTPKVDNTKTDKVVKMAKIQDIATPIKKDVKLAENKISTLHTIEGAYLLDTWGKSTVSKNNNEYTVTGGDENVELATIYKTSKPTFFIIKWRAFKQPQLVELDANGNLNIDTNSGLKVYKRI